ncbi:RagB/SusD family nutrient uptake outer membrane protein [Rufibacter immobilis]|uniref:RagB/SusD family nutrient uptake outer membrane protein n=1 Tax=Rufibacter immobilis TaxID=1348778 RepID=A0A3M9MVV9_9BACT|nr:RagB/SusD family nutrient uptake outer membrane protein [Rufibacter immobilis]RNI29666.1 RagB/SusD family nutrient uptake outer membrane protein [Rufibacter immobilis]
MKNIKTIALALGMLSLNACQDFLETEPITQLTETNFYRTPDDAFKALVGCYDGLQRVWADGISLPVASEIMSDNSFGGTGNADGFNHQAIDEFDMNRSPADRNLFGPNWTAYYAAVYRCNVLIGKMDQIEWGNQANLRNTYEAEARFLRAYLYFDMVRLWGNIPLLTEPSAENLPQANPDEVYKVIAQDLKFAASNLAATPYTAQSTATYGRVTKWAAEALLGRVFLYYTGYYGKADLVGEVDKTQALAYVEDVITNGGFDLVDDYAKLWPAASLSNYAGEDNKETVFAIKYSHTSNYDGNTDGNHWMVMTGMREQFSYPYGNGWGGATVNPKLWNAFSDNDTRKVASIISIAGEKIDFKNKPKQREYTGYYIKKYSPLVDEQGNSLPVNMGAVNFMIGQYQDYVSIRYADVLLMAAELGSPNAQAYFDKVRRRAYQSKFTALSVSQANIMNERRLEFAGEGHRYFDLLRQGLNVAAAAIAETTTLENGGVPTTKTISAEKVLQTKGLQQIPYNQVTLSNGMLKQNAGW